MLIASVVSGLLIYRRVGLLLNGCCGLKWSPPTPRITFITEGIPSRGEDRRKIASGLVLFHRPGMRFDVWSLLQWSGLKGRAADSSSSLWCLWLRLAPARCWTSQPVHRRSWRTGWWRSARSPWPLKRRSAATHMLSSNTGAAPHHLLPKLCSVSYESCDQIDLKCMPFPKNVFCFWSRRLYDIIYD